MGVLRLTGRKPRLRKLDKMSMHIPSDFLKRPWRPRTTPRMRKSVRVVMTLQEKVRLPVRQQAVSGQLVRQPRIAASCPARRSHWTRPLSASSSSVPSAPSLCARLALPRHTPSSSLPADNVISHTTYSCVTVSKQLQRYYRVGQKNCTVFEHPFLYYSAILRLGLLSSSYCEPSAVSTFSAKDVLKSWFKSVEAGGTEIGFCNFQLKQYNSFSSVVNFSTNW